MTQPFEGLAIALALAGQVFAGAWWASGQSEKAVNIQDRLAIVERQLTAEANGKVIQADRLARMEEHIIELSKTAGEIKDSLARRRR